MSVWQVVTEQINVKGARTNNLKNISVTIPKGKITVLAGVSGSGKSSLAFSTIAAAAQRQVNKTYSAYVQQLLPQFKEPEVDSIENLPFPIVVDQKGVGINKRSTLGTYSDLYSALRLLFSRIAKPFIGYSMNYSFNNPAGMCSTCDGLGKIRKIVPHKLLDFNKSLNAGAIRFPTFQPGGWRLLRYTESGFFDNNLPLKEWPDSKFKLLLNANKQIPPHPTAKWHKTAKYMGIIPRIEQTFLKKDSAKYQTELKRIVKVSNCPSCNGKRLNSQVLSAKILNKNIADCCEMSLEDLSAWLDLISASQVQTIIQELKEKIANLIEAGLGYLNLARTTSSLSGGEAQRVKMANYLNSNLNNVLYIFDEPSVGLHPFDLIKIKKIFQLLRQKGNTIIIVDHDPQMIELGDQIINLGELAGEAGGYVTFNGTFQQLKQSNTLTGKSLRNLSKIKKAKRPITGLLQINDAHKNNLKHVSVKIPKQALTVITGVAGSGKSSLVSAIEEQYPGAAVLNQRQINGSNRSNVLTYLNVFDRLRQYYAKATKQDLSLFSFNSKGACPVCKGKGLIKLDLAYLGESDSLCEACHGLRYSSEVLQFKINGLNIAEAMELSAGEFLKKFPIFKKEMRILQLVDLGYLKLKQSLDTFSGGELQRLKLAKFLLNKESNILILDEPTNGLHEYNIQELINLLTKLISKFGVSIIMIEHNLRVMGQADWLVDIGPYAGNKGGKVLFSGHPLDLLKRGNTLTAKALKKYYQNSDIEKG